MPEMVQNSKLKTQNSSSALHFRVPPGIGDISWVYSKLVNLGQPLIMEVARSNRPRSLPYLELLPHVRHAASCRDSVASVLSAPDLSDWTVERLTREAADRPVTIQLNHWLESGKRIEGYIPDLPVDHHYAMYLRPADVALAESLLGSWKRWVVFYCANQNTVRRWRGWQASQWAELALLFMGHYDLDGVVLVGAKWDRPMGQSVLNAVFTRGGGRVPTLDLVGRLPLSGTLHVIRRALYTVAFPSGIPILAAVMRRPALMFYPRHLKPMQNAWADPEMVESGDYKGCQFCPPQKAFDWIHDDYELPWNRPKGADRWWLLTDH